MILDRPRRLYRNRSLWPENAGGKCERNVDEVKRCTLCKVSPCIYVALFCLTTNFINLTYSYYYYMSMTILFLVVRIMIYAIRRDHTNTPVRLRRNRQIWQNRREKKKRVSHDTIIAINAHNRMRCAL